MRRAALLLGYHGCDRKVGESILKEGGEIRPSANQFDWLGGGAYFWENSYSRALHWANFLCKKPGSSASRITNPFVIGAIIDPGNCLDLTEHESLDVLKSAYNPFKKAMSIVGKEMPQNERAYSGDEDLVKRKLDCAVIEYLHSVRKQKGMAPFDSVRAPFVEGSGVFKGSKIHAMTHLQWCIRDPKTSILAYFRPRKPHSNK